MLPFEGQHTSELLCKSDTFLSQLHQIVQSAILIATSRTLTFAAIPAPEPTVRPTNRNRFFILLRKSKALILARPRCGNEQQKEPNAPENQPMQQSTSQDLHRQFDRRPVKAHVFVHCHGHFQRANVVDYSHGGLQLEGTFGLSKRDAIEVELISGTRVPAQVAWSLGAHTGVTFGGPLPTHHPAMIELARKTDLRSV
jgi:PilZ domain